MTPTPDLVLTAFVVFCRIGACLLVIPGFSSPRIPMRARLFVAIAIALALTPLLLPEVRPTVAAAAPIGILTLIMSESLKGLLIGLLGRFFFVALETMTMSVSLAIGLTASFGGVADDDGETPTIVALVSLVAMLLVFVTDLHWELFRGLAASYNVLPVAQAFDPRVGLLQLVDEAARTFLFTLCIASPFLVFSVVANFAIGLVNKLVPSVPVTFVATPFLIAGGLVILYFSIKPALELFTGAFAAWLRGWMSADRAKSLDRIARVQAQMVRLAELRRAAADGHIRALGEDRTRLVDYVAGTGALGVPLAKAALRSIEALDRRRAEAERVRAAEAARLDALRRRGRAVTSMAEAASRDARRAAETTELAAIMDAWLAARDA